MIAVSNWKSMARKRTVLGRLRPTTTCAVGRLLAASSASLEMEPCTQRSVVVTSKACVGTCCLELRKLILSSLNSIYQDFHLQGSTAESKAAATCALFACLISHQPAVLFSHNKPATSNQLAVLFSQNKPAPAIRHQPTEQTVEV
jgi:hypothetical protein